MIDYDLCPLTPRTLQEHEVTLLVAMYFPYEEIGNAVNVCRLESGFKTHAWNRNGEDSRGLMQINVVDAAHPELRQYNLFDPQVNLFFAYRIWRDSGWRAWYNSAISLGLIAR